MSVLSYQNHCRKLPAMAGIGLRQPHYDDFFSQQPKVGWVEVHPENYFDIHSPPAEWLLKIRQQYPLSLHGVGLSLGSTDPLSEEHLAKLAELIAIYEPALISEHLCWTSQQGIYFQDLLPLPQSSEVITHLVQRIGQVQDYLKRPIAIENVSSYIQVPGGEMTEWEFLLSTAKQAGCLILLDINNIYVNAQNHGFSAKTFIDAIPADWVAEIHLAGHTSVTLESETILVDTHGDVVCDEVWELYRYAIAKYGPKPTLIEWDTDLPSLNCLVGEANKAQYILDNAYDCAS
ncbi:DUF692 domain-containing protein [Zooshikella marina]|uniref:MNIO family bufferin maturase n=1 Tax=Zooshikella ganghwensis TaxID=202772 RepID=UPI000688F30F|nr:DUF692 domain-containing protein [Zooshikella ganghwensis]MBU2708303.1 DUF692 domain-containing protein [Zooshikella ganghwensis]